MIIQTFNHVYVRRRSILLGIRCSSFYLWFELGRYITRDELRQAMTKYGMGDEATIDEIIDDVDTDKVTPFCFCCVFFIIDFNTLKLTEY